MKSAMILSILLACLVLTGCTAKKTPEAAPQSAEITRAELVPQTGTTEAVPDAYLTPSDRPGTVTRLDYDSLDDVGSQAQITAPSAAFPSAPSRHGRRGLDRQRRLLLGEKHGAIL